MLRISKRLMFKQGVAMLLTFGIVFAEELVLGGEATYLERIALPQNTVFEATLEDISLMDMPSVTLGRVTIAHAGQVPIPFEITYNTDQIKKGHRYNVRAKIKVDGKILFITDTVHTVLDGSDQTALHLIMKKVKQKVKMKPFKQFPIHFIGRLPGANCQSQYQLDLFSDHTYFIRNKCFKNDMSDSVQSDNIGRWHFDSEKKQLILTGGGERDLFFLVLGPETIEKLDNEGERIHSNLNYKLEASYSAATLEPQVYMEGMYQYMADAAMFHECITGLNLPVLFEKNNIALENAYNKDKKEAGALLKIHLEGKIVQRPKMEGEGIQAHLLVERFIKTMPNEQCDPPNAKK